MSMQHAIRSLRVDAGLSQAELANKLGIDRSAISQWETGRTLPDLIRLSQLAKACDCLEQDFFTRAYEGKKDNSSKHKAPDAVCRRAYDELRFTVPFVTLPGVENGDFVNEELVGQNVEVPPNVVREHPNAQALTLNSDCMSRVIPKGSAVVFDPSLDPTNGHIAIVETIEHQAIIRRWYKGQDVLLLSADSYTPYTDIVVTSQNPVRVMGTVAYVHVPRKIL